MRVEIKGNQCIVTKEKGDPRFKDSGWGSGDSTLLFQIKKALITQGYDLIKKRMWKDGHLVDDTCLYLCTRKPSGDPEKDIYIYDGNYQIRNAAEDFYKEGKVVYNVEKDVFKKETK